MKTKLLLVQVNWKRFFFLKKVTFELSRVNRIAICKNNTALGYFKTFTWCLRCRSMTGELLSIVSVLLNDVRLKKAKQRHRIQIKAISVSITNHLYFPITLLTENYIRAVINSLHNGSELRIESRHTTLITVKNFPIIKPSILIPPKNYSTSGEGVRLKSGIYDLWCVNFWFLHVWDLFRCVKLQSLANFFFQTSFSALLIKINVALWNSSPVSSPARSRGNPNCEPAIETAKYFISRR